MAKPQEPMNVTVLSGGPDAEAEISRKSAATISRALRAAGHRVNELNLPPHQPESLLPGIPQDHVVFPALHGPWGEGGGVGVQEGVEAGEDGGVGSAANMGGSRAGPGGGAS